MHVIYDEAMTLLPMLPNSNYFLIIFLLKGPGGGMPEVDFHFLSFLIIEENGSYQELFCYTWYTRTTLE